jgi:hypothetical protein
VAVITLPSWLPLWAVRWIVWLALGVAVWGGVTRYGAARYAAGRNSVTAVAPFDVTMLGAVHTADNAATAKTDTIRQRTVVTRWKVDTLIREIPDTLASIPHIKGLIAAARVLTAQVDTLTHTIDVERAISRVRASADSAALSASARIITNRDDQIVALKKRPVWRTVALALGAGVVVGLLR